MWARRLRALLRLCLLLCIVPAVAEAVEVSATAAVLLDADTGQLLYEKNGDEQMLIASTTKIMTALVVLEQAGLDDTVTVTRDHMAEGSSMYLKPGETVRVEELLYGLLLCSGNDAALALTACAGGPEPFVALMNEKAAALGMTRTSFANPNGLDAEGHYSTARDMAVLAAAAMEEPTFRRICSSRSVTIGQRTMENHNRLLRQVEKRIADGDAHAKLIYDAMLYSAARAIGGLAAGADGRVDRIILTGGIAHSKYVAAYLTKKLSFIAPVEVMAGEFELEALAAGACRVLEGRERPKHFALPAAQA